MGNHEIKDLYSTKQVFLYDINQIDKSERLFQSKLSILSYNTQLIKKQYTFTPATEHITNYIQKLSFLGQHFDCDNLMMPIYCYVRQEKGLCSDEKQLQIYHQIYNINIREQIQIRRKLNQMFSESEIWYLLFSVINACRKFQPFKIKSGNLRSDSIQLNQKGHVKLKNIFTQPENKFADFPNYYSPEELMNLKENRQRKLHPNICQTYSIAIIILEICMFKDGETFYDIFRMKINETAIGRAFQTLEKLAYSKLLINLLRIMLSSVVDRPLPSQIYLAFKPYEKQIFALQKFSFDSHKIYNSLQNSNATMGINY